MTGKPAWVEATNEIINSVPPCIPASMDKIIKAACEAHAAEETRRADDFDRLWRAAAAKAEQFDDRLVRAEREVRELREIVKTLARRTVPEDLPGTELMSVELPCAYIREAKRLLSRPEPEGSKAPHPCDNLDNPSLGPEPEAQQPEEPKLGAREPALQREITSEELKLLYNQGNPLFGFKKDLDK